MGTRLLLGMILVGSIQSFSVCHANAEFSLEDEICTDVPAFPSNQPLDDTPELRQNMVALWNCVRAHWLSFDRSTWAAVTQFKRFERLKNEPYSSWLSPRQLREKFADFDFRFPFSFEQDAAQSAHLRVSYTDLDLDEWIRLTRMRRSLLLRVEIQVMKALEQRRAELEVYSFLDRYRFLLAFQHVGEDPSGKETMDAWKKLLPDAGKRWRFVPSENDQEVLQSWIHPFAWASLLPEPGHEFDGLSEHPFGAIFRERHAGLAMDGPLRATRFALYTKYRNQTPPFLQATPPLDPSAVKVIFAGAGLDFATQSALDGWVDPKLSMDFSPDWITLDGTLKQGLNPMGEGSNPWLPSSVDGFQEETFLVDAFQRALQQEAPDLLKSRLIVPGFWKVGSIKEVLGDPLLRPRPAYPLWSSRPAFQEAVLKALQSPQEQAPSVWVSPFESGLADLVKRLGNPTILKQARWIWILAAGVQAKVEPLAEEHCFNDLSEEQRPSAQLLCVGTVKPGPLQPNGERADVIRSSFYRQKGVEVFAYEGVDGKCPKRQSCSAAIIAAAASVIRARYPLLSAAQVKESILAASRERTLKVEGGTQMNVKFFDLSSIPRALNAARKRK